MTKGSCKKTNSESNPTEIPMDLYHIIVMFSVVIEIGNFYANIERKNLDIFKMKFYLPLDQIQFEDNQISDQIKTHMQ
jgi:hypothetical protein